MAMSKREYRTMLDDLYEPIRFGNLTYDYGWALEKLDPIAFDESYWSFVHSIDDEEEEEYSTSSVYGFNR